MPLPSAPTGLPLLLTGASGFVGQTVCRHLLAAGWPVIGQSLLHAVPPGVTAWRCDVRSELDRLEDLPPLGAIIHLAGLAHVPVRRVDRQTVWASNVAPVERLAQWAARRRIPLIYLSSAKVLGESGRWDDRARPAPADLYAESKLAAETVLRQVLGPQATVLRPPLMHGPQVKGNFLALLRWAAAGWPLPLAALDNRRSVLHVDNLAAAIVACLRQPAACADQTWLISDGEALGMATLFRRLAAGLGRPARLFGVPAPVLRQLAGACGRAALAERLTGPFEIDDSGMRAKLIWQPPLSAAAALTATARWYRQAHGPDGDGASA